jgi:uncharacterized protein YjbJ (UPF0337 family)
MSLTFGEIESRWPHSDNPVLRSWSVHFDTATPCIETYDQDSDRTKPQSGRISRAQEAFPMNRSTKDKAKGKLHELKGQLKEKVGRLTKNPDLEAEGQGEKIAGKVQKKIGQVEKVFEK